MEEDLAWIQEDTERAPIEEVKATLAASFEGVPADLCDDLQICRFLRGHDNNPVEAAKFLEKAVAYRSELISREPFKSVRAACLNAEAADPSVLPHYAEVSRVLPIRNLQGAGASGNPIMSAIPRLIDFEALAALGKTEDGDQKLDEFLRSFLEQRATVLFNLSQKRKRMVKYDDLRDMTQVSIPSVISSGLVGKLKSMLSTIQDFYPESIHQVAIWSAPPAFSKLFGLISNVLNKRMQAKIKVYQRGTFFNDIAERVDAVAIHSWLQQATGTLDFSNITILNGCQELTSKWLAKGDACTWTLSVEDGADIKLHRIFVPAAGAGETVTLSEEDVDVKAGEPHNGNFTADCDGVLVINLDNYYSWWNTKQVVLTFE